MEERTLFQIWCVIVLLARSLGIFLGYFSPQTIHKRVYPYVPKRDIHPLFGRMWSNWTIVSLSLLTMMALYPENVQVYILNFIAFSVALIHFVLETFYFRTSIINNLVIIFVAAGCTMGYMAWRWVNGYVGHMDPEYY